MKLPIPFRLPRRHTRWVTLTSYSTYDKNFLVMVRGNIRTGMLRFKCIRIQAKNITTTDRIDINKHIDLGVQWLKFNQILNAELEAARTQHKTSDSTPA